MPPPQTLAIAVAIALGVTLVIGLAGRFIPSGGGRTPSTLNLALAAGFAATLWYFQGTVPQYKPFQAFGAVVWITLGAALVATVASTIATLPLVVRAIAFAVAAAAATYFLIIPLAQFSSLAPAALAGKVALLAAAPIGWYVILSLLAESKKDSPGLAPFVCAGLLGLSGVLALMSASIARGQAGAFVAIPLIAVALVGFVRPALLRVTPGAVTLSTCLIATALLGDGHYYAALRPDQCLLLLASPLLLIFTLFGPLAKLRGWKRNVVVVMLAVLPAAAAVAWQTPAFVRDLNEKSEESYESY